MMDANELRTKRLAAAERAFEDYKKGKDPRHVQFQVYEWSCNDVGDKYTRIFETGPSKEEATGDEQWDTDAFNVHFVHGSDDVAGVTTNALS